jgi:hypothetical protein
MRVVVGQEKKEKGGHNHNKEAIKSTKNKEMTQRVACSPLSGFWLMDLLVIAFLLLVAFGRAAPTFPLCQILP